MRLVRDILTFIALAPFIIIALIGLVVAVLEIWHGNWASRLGFVWVISIVGALILHLSLKESSND